MKVAEGTPTKIPGSQIETRWVLVTPDMAKLYMVANVDNRLIRDKHIDRLKDDMTHDRFHTTHQGIAFDEDGKMIDGQHRCKAIIDSGKGQWMLVTTGLPEMSQRVIDGGAKRAAHDMMPGKFKAIRAAALRLYLGMEYCNSEFTGSTLAFAIQQVTAASIQNAWDDFPEMEELAGLSSEASRNVPTCGPAALLASGILYPDTAKEFLVGTKLMSGLEVGDPRLALLKFRGGPKRIQSSIAAVVAVKAARAFSRGKQMNIMRYSPTEKVKI